MPRNASGTFTLVTGNPVVAGTTIESTWANTTLSDIATELTNSLSRTGQGGMTAAFRLADGTLAAPGLAFLNETGTGLYRAGSGEMWSAVQGAQIQQYTINGVLIPTGKTFTAQGDSTLANLSYTGTLTGGTGVVNLGSGQFYKSATGDVGIGTSSPDSKLTLASAATAATRVINNIGATTGATYGRWTNTGSDLVWGIESSAGGALLTGASAYAAVLYTNNSVPLQFGTAGTIKATIDASGNLGLGVTPSAWGSLYKAIDIGATTSFSADTNFGSPRVSANVYWNSSSNPIYKLTGVASYYEQRGNTGAHSWYTAPSGTAGNAISFTQAMTLDASGNLGVGTTSTSDGRLWVDSGATSIVANFNSTAANGGYIRFQSSGTSIGDIGAGAEIVAGGSASDFGINARGSRNLILGTNNTERARITSGGDLLVGTTTNTENYKENLQFSGASTNGLLVKNTSSTGAPLHLGIVDSAQSLNDTSSSASYQDNVAGRWALRKNGGLANYSANDVNLSDRREKTNFAPAKSYLDVICAIPVQTFEYIDQSEDDPGLTLGVVAQDVQAVAPELVMESNWGTADEPKVRLSIYQTDLQYALMKCIQEQQALITDLRARVAALES